ncbi:MAG: GAF domain-containing protein, partial [Candidatus Omnitrophica bacterium]|nr:GAF domain-containing protein [Candidatus Omnitrophota bacterium]
MEDFFINEFEKICQIKRGKYNFKNFYENILKYILNSFKSDSGSLFLREGNFLCLKATINTKAPSNLKVKTNERIVGKIFKDGKPYIIHDLNDTPFRNLKPRKEIKSSIIFPLKNGSGVFGVITLNSHRKEIKYSEKDLKKLQKASSIILITCKFSNLCRNLHKNNLKIKNFKELYYRLLLYLTHEISNSITFIKHLYFKINGEKEVLKLLNFKLDYINNLVENFYFYSVSKEINKRFFLPCCVQLKILLDKIVREKKEIYIDKELDIKVDSEDYLVKLEPVSGQLILENLIDNAFKYTFNRI